MPLAHGGVEVHSAARWGRGGICWLPQPPRQRRLALDLLRRGWATGGATRGLARDWLVLPAAPAGGAEAWALFRRAHARGYAGRARWRAAATLHLFYNYAARCSNTRFTSDGWGS